MPRVPPQPSLVEDAAVFACRSAVFLTGDTAAVRTQPWLETGYTNFLIINSLFYIFYFSPHRSSFLIPYSLFLIS